MEEKIQLSAFLCLLVDRRNLKSQVMSNQGPNEVCGWRAQLTGTVATMVSVGSAVRGGASDDICGSNRLLEALLAKDRNLIDPCLSLMNLSRNSVLFDVGDDVGSCYFPCGGTMVSLVVPLPDGVLAETATVGCEGALGGIVSMGHKPAFARAVVQIAGTAARMDSDRLEELKSRSATLRDTLARYADCMIAQVLQSVACNMRHSLERRFCRWLLTAQDRVGGDVILLTHEFLAEALGVQRTTVTAVATSLQTRGLINYSRGRITVTNRPALRAAACECHDMVVQHFERVLPGVYPQLEPPTQ